MLAETAARNQLFVHFHRDALSLEIELFHQIGHGGVVGYLSLSAVDENLHPDVTLEDSLRGNSTINLPVVSQHPEYRENAPLKPWSEDLIPLDSARTLDGLFVQRVRRSPERVAYRRFQRGEQSWTALTWMDMERQVGRWQQALSEQGLQPGDRVAVALRNGPEWVMFDQASLGLGLVTVPLYTDDRAENAAYILQDAAARLLLIQDAGRWRRLAPVIGGHRHPERVVLLDSGAEAQRLARQDPRVVTAHQWLPEQAQSR